MNSLSIYRSLKARRLSNENNHDQRLKLQNQRRKSLPDYRSGLNSKRSLIDSTSRDSLNLVLFKPIKRARSIEKELQLSRELNSFLNNDQSNERRNQDSKFEIVNEKNEFSSESNLSFSVPSFQQIQNLTSSNSQNLTKKTAFRYTSSNTTEERLKSSTPTKKNLVNVNPNQQQSTHRKTTQNTVSFLFE